MQPRDVEEGRRRLNSPCRDQRAFWLLPQTAGAPHPARPCPLQSPKRALVTASLWLPSGLAARRSAADFTPDALFHSSASLSAPQVQTEAQIFSPFGTKCPFGQLSAKSGASTCNSCPVTTPLGNSG